MVMWRLNGLGVVLDTDAGDQLVILSSLIHLHSVVPSPFVSTSVLFQARNVTCRLITRVRSDLPVTAAVPADCFAEYDVAEMRSV